MNKRLKIFIVDDHQIFIQGLELLLEQFPEFYVAGSAENGADLFEELGIIVPDVIILDLNMPIMSGEQVLEILVTNYPEVKVIILSMDFNKGAIEKYFTLGAHGFLPKNCGIDSLRKTINLVALKGQSKEMSITLYDELMKKTDYKTMDNSGLSEREIDILKLVCQGKRNKHIADILCIALRTVEWHKTNIFKKTKCDTIADLINYCHRLEIR